MPSLRHAVRRAGVRRHRVAALRLWCERSLLAARGGEHAPAAAGRILCYHSVGTQRWGVNDVSPKRFARHLELALEAGVRFVPAETIARGDGGPADIALTFDDGLRSVAVNAAPVLRSMNVPWTLFVVSDWADGKANGWAEGLLLDWREIERLAADGANIGSHSVTHATIGALPETQMRYELEASREAIRDRLGIVTREFAIPVGRARDWSEAAGAAAAAAGYTSVYAASHDRRPSGTVPRTFMTQFDGDRVFRAALRGRFDGWEEWF